MLFRSSFACAAVPAWAASGTCARSADLTALRAIDVQQQLMVSALNCSEVARYNAFQTRYRNDLLSQDDALLGFMRRIKGARGESAYHAYKTRAANDAQLRFIADPVGYCANTRLELDQALGPDNRVTLASLVSAQPLTVSNTYSSCDIQLTGNVAASAPRVVPVPIPKPVEEVLPAQGGGVVVSSPFPVTVGLKGTQQ